MTADEAVQRAREIAARLSGVALPPSAPSTRSTTLFSQTAAELPNRDQKGGDTIENNDEEGEEGTNTSGKKRKRWGVMPPNEAIPPGTLPAMSIDTDATKDARAKALAAVAKAVAPGALTVVAKPKPPPVTRRVWVDANTMLSDDRPAAHFVAYGNRHWNEIVEKLNKEAKDKNPSINVAANGNSDKTTSEDLVTIEFKGRGASDRPPVLGMPEEPLHVHIFGPKVLVEQAELLVEDILEQAKTAPIEEDAINARLAAEGALTAIGGSFNPTPMKAVSTYRPASVAQLIGQANIPLEQRLLDSNATLIEESIGVPNGIVGFIIGRGGENIASMQAKTGCKVQIQKEHELQPGQTERTITLQAVSQEAVNACRAIIENLVAERVRAVGGSSNRSGHNTNITDKQQQASLNLDPVQQALAIGHKVVEVDVPDADVGLVIGKGGTTIKSIQEQTGATIQVPKQGNVDNPALRTLQITHPEEQGALMAKEMVENVLKTKPGYLQQMAMLRQQQHLPSQTGTQQPDCSVQVMIPDKDVGLVIGRQGCVIKYMQNTTRTKIQIPPQVAQPGDMYRTATIIGPSLEGCNQVRQMIDRIIAEQSSASIMAAAQQHQLYSNGPSGYGQQQYPYQNQQSQQNYGSMISQESQEGYSAEWAAYHAAVAAQQQQSTSYTPSVPPQTLQETYGGWTADQYQQYYSSASSTPAAQAKENVATATTVNVEAGQQQPAADAYYEQYFRYEYYYGEQAARQYYGAWAPPLGTPNPYGVNPNVQPPPAVTASGSVAGNGMETASGAVDVRETSQRQVSNLPAWMTKK